MPTVRCRCCRETVNGWFHICRNCGVSIRCDLCGTTSHLLAYRRTDLTICENCGVGYCIQCGSVGNEGPLCADCSLIRPDAYSLLVKLVKQENMKKEEKEESMPKHTIRLKAKVTPKGTEVYIKSAFLENLFKKVNLGVYSKENIGIVYNENGELLYQYYMLPSLPDDCPCSLQVGTDIYNQLGFLRAKGLSKGIKLVTPQPISKKLAQRVAEDIQRTADYLEEVYRGAYVINTEIRFSTKTTTET